MSDIVERLREYPGADIRIAADEIESLRSRLDEELAAQDFTYSRKTNDLIERHAKQIDELRSRLAEAELTLSVVRSRLTARWGRDYDLVQVIDAHLSRKGESHE